MTTKLEPLDKFAGYNIRRNNNTVSFGCGAVIVNKSDLTTLAKAKTTNTAQVTAVARLSKLFILRSTSVTYRSNIKNLIKDVSLFKEVDQKLFIAVNNLIRASSDRYSTSRLLAIPAETLYRIAGRKSITTKTSKNASTKKSTSKESASKKALR